MLSPSTLLRKVYEDFCVCIGMGVKVNLIISASQFIVDVDFNSRWWLLSLGISQDHRALRFWEESDVGVSGELLALQLKCCRKMILAFLMRDLIVIIFCENILNNWNGLLGNWGKFNLNLLYSPSARGQ